MPTRTCPHCQAITHFGHRWSVNYDQNSADGFNAFAEQCDNCGKPICGISAYKYVEETGESELAYEYVWPLIVAQTAYPDVPQSIAGAAREAHQALAASAPHASVMMARATIEATAKDKGITRGNLETKINHLAAEGHISQSMKDAAHEIRFAGNDAAHGDIVDEPINIDDAREIIELMDTILERVYQEPAKVARVRASREARRSRPEPTTTTS
jgi:Domain of unknown function (DUF4145)